MTTAGLRHPFSAEQERRRFLHLTWTLAVTEWKLRFKPDAGLTLRPTPRPEGMHLDLAFVPGSAEVPELLLALVCWSIVTEEATGPARLGS